MKTTKHAEKRMQQRGRSGVGFVDQIFEYGVGISASRGATFYRIPDKIRRARIEYHQERIRCLTRSSEKERGQK